MLKWSVNNIKQEGVNNPAGKEISIKGNHSDGSIGFAPTQDCIHFLKIRFVVAGVGFFRNISTKGIN